jgi:hypothetical protein
LSAANAIMEARVAGMHLGVEGDDLVLRAAAKPPPVVLERLSRHKSAIVSWLRPTSGGWSREDWRDYFEERAAIREHDGGMSRTDAEAGALADCVARWRAFNPLPASSDGACVQCGKARPDTPVLARGGHAWLHRECWAPMNAEREEMARRAVEAALGLPSGGAGP